MKRCQTCNIIGGDNQTACYADGQPLVDDPLATSLQEAIGEKYSLTKLIGQGAMGAVYRAHHRDLGDVAIKVMLAQEGDNQTLSERFLREARALRRLRHQNAVFIYDLDRSPKGVTYMVMEMVAGRSLGEDLRERKRGFSLDETMEIATAVCSALSAAHERGIIHRDLKPDNILRAEETGIDGHTIRTIKIADFGIVKQRGGDDNEPSLHLTKSGRPIGTPFYMSPEQWFGDGPGINALDHRTDIYALGCTLYELLAARPPFVGRTTEEMLHHHLHDEPTPLHALAPQVPLPVSRVIMRALAKDRDERQQSAAEFIEELRAAYDQSFEHTNQKIDDRFSSTQESLTDEPSATGAPHRLIDTEESLPMFAEKVLALDSLSLPATHDEQHPSNVDSQALPLAAQAGPTQQQEQPLSADFVSTPTPTQSFSFEQDNRAPEQVAPSQSSLVQTNSRRKFFLILASVALLLGTVVAIMIGVYLYRERQQNLPVASEQVQPPQEQFKPPPIPMSALMGTLRVRATPGSEVFIDDEKAGTVDVDGLFTAQVPVGLRNVRVVAKGFRPWARDARVKANEQATLNAARERPVELAEVTTEEREKRALTAYDKKDFNAAEAEYRGLLKTAPEEAEAHVSLGRILVAQQRYAEAITEFEAAAQLDAKNTEARETLTRLYLMKGRDAEAETFARQLLKLTPRDAQAHHLLSRVLLRDPNKLEEAASEIEIALQSKETPEFLETKAYILLSRNSTDEALKAAESAVELSRSKTSGPRAARAVVLFRLERVAEAVSLYRQLRHEDKNDRWGDIRWLQLQRGYSKPVLETLAALIARTN
jgi:serine/threonine protein kinase/tetratricopeptide (TPR) repeat protein